MVRVITEDSKDNFNECDKVKELKNAHIDYENKIIYYDGDFAHTFMLFGDIFKIEKQAKDLTLGECYMLNIYRDSYDDLYREDGFKQIPLSFDDYIDITGLVMNNG